MSVSRPSPIGGVICPISAHRSRTTAGGLQLHPLTQSRFCPLCRQADPLPRARKGSAAVSTAVRRPSRPAAPWLDLCTQAAVAHRGEHEPCRSVSAPLLLSASH